MAFLLSFLISLSILEAAVLLGKFFCSNFCSGKQKISAVLQSLFSSGTFMWKIGLCFDDFEDSLISEKCDTSHRRWVWLCVLWDIKDITKAVFHKLFAWSYVTSSCYTIKMLQWMSRCIVILQTYQLLSSKKEKKKKKKILSPFLSEKMYPFQAEFAEEVSLPLMLLGCPSFWLRLPSFFFSFLLVKDSSPEALKVTQYYILLPGSLLYFNL